MTIVIVVLIGVVVLQLIGIAVVLDEIKELLAFREEEGTSIFP